MTQMSSDQYPIVMNDSMLSVIRGIRGVKHAERFAYKQGILKTDSDFLGVMLKGVAQEFDSTFIHQNLIAGSFPKFADDVSSNKIVISKNIADKLNLKLNQRLFAYFIDNNGIRVRRFTIAGIYQTNLNQYDEVMCFTDLNTAVKLNGWESDHYGETYTSQTIQDINPQIFQWLDLLDMNVWIILVLMISVAGVTMVSGLLIIILERTTMIGIFKALGARNKTVRHMFLWFATFIIGRGLLIGNAVAIGLSLIQKYFGMVKLDPSTYYISTVPIEFNIPALLLINILTLAISVFVLIAPSYLISHIHPAKSMRYE